jgi:hypothetical protein
MPLGSIVQDSTTVIQGSLQRLLLRFSQKNSEMDVASTMYNSFSFVMDIVQSALNQTIQHVKTAKHIPNQKDFFSRDWKAGALNLGIFELFPENKDEILKLIVPVVVILFSLYLLHWAVASMLSMLYKITRGVIFMTFVAIALFLVSDILGVI